MFEITQIDAHELEKTKLTLWQPKFKSFISKFLLQDLLSVETSIANLIQISPSKTQDLNNKICSKVIIKDYESLINWRDSFQAMIDFTRNRTENTLDQILLLQHEPVFTQGVNGSPNHVLNNKFNIPIMQADRGGQVTYHGPKQQIIYLLIDFERKKKEFAEFDLKFYARSIVTAMENAVVNILTHIGISKVHAKPDAPGIYIENKKVSSLGLKVTRHGTYHGIAINIDMDLEPFHSINPCGYAGLEMCNICDYINPQSLVSLELLTPEQAQNLTPEEFYSLVNSLINEYFISYLVNSFAYTEVYKI
ncbi:lipoyl(octanoyl) transferase LipB [Psittacicella gerlachiana]|uniref:Octanoyltransferase n=1 Tax=Psittacicella gerlachiana TaxID=2028574 RepID=A0A3A1Y2J1_9GAMM|nr:lipoyl(octanoyl) transferase LipB [Psittacicella gerlachiana]RIY31620.1 hypothetical protein CKF59_07505 [Psittacicella gerlachiana]